MRGPATPTNPLRPGPLEWPFGTSAEGQRVELRAMQAKPNSGLYAGFLMDPQRRLSYFTMYHQHYRVLIGYIWRTQDFPWMGDWQENRRAKQPPWNGQVIARGMEFGTTPFGGPMRQVVEEGRLFGVPVYRWIGGGERLTARYLAFLAEIPAGFRGVADVQVGDKTIVITERETGNRIAVAGAPAARLDSPE